MPRQRLLRRAKNVCVFSSVWSGLHRNSSLTAFGVSVIVRPQSLSSPPLHELQEGMRVRISHQAKRITIEHSSNNQIDEPSPWVSEMDDTILRMGVVRLVEFTLFLGSFASSSFNPPLTLTLIRRPSGSNKYAPIAWTETFFEVCVYVWDGCRRRTKSSALSLKTIGNSFQIFFLPLHGSSEFHTPRPKLLTFSSRRALVR